MTNNDEIAKLAREYAEENGDDTALFIGVRNVLSWLLRIHSIVSKEDTVISGWAAIDEAYDACFLHTSKPHQESQEIADTGDYNTVWESDGKTYLLDRGFFPDMDSGSNPMEVEITIKPKKR